MPPALVAWELLSEESDVAKSLLQHEREDLGSCPPSRGCLDESMTNATRYGMTHRKFLSSATTATKAYI